MTATLSTTLHARGASVRRTLLFGAVYVYVGLLLALPVAALVVTTVGTDLGTLARALIEPTTVHALTLTFLLCLGSVVVNALVGTAGALVIARQRFFGRARRAGLADLPLAVSPVVVGLGFLLLFGRSGVFYPRLEAAGVRVVFNTTGLVIATLFVTLPFTMREAAYVLDELGDVEEEAARTLGASPWQTFWYVTLPNIRYALGYGLMMTAARALGEFGAVLILGGGVSGETETATVFIHNMIEERNEIAAFGVASLLCAASFTVLALLEWVRRRREEMAG